MKWNGFWFRWIHARSLTLITAQLRDVYLRAAFTALNDRNLRWRAYKFATPTSNSVQGEWYTHKKLRRFTPWKLTSITWKLMVGRWNFLFEMVPFVGDIGSFFGGISSASLFGIVNTSRSFVDIFWLKNRNFARCCYSAITLFKDEDPLNSYW